MICCGWRMAPLCLADRLLHCRFKWVCDWHDRLLTQEYDEEPPATSNLAAGYVRVRWYRSTP